MKKILLIIGLILICSNIVYAESYINDSIEYTSTYSYDYNLGATLSGGNEFSSWSFYYESQELTGQPSHIRITNVRINEEDGIYIPNTVGAPFWLYDGSNLTGRGQLEIKNLIGTNLAQIDIYFYPYPYCVFEDDTLYSMQIYSGLIDEYYEQIYYYNGISAATLKNNLHSYVSTHPSLIHFFLDYYPTGQQGVYDYFYEGTFRNDYSIYLNGDIGQTDIIRDGFDQYYLTSSKYIIKNSTGGIIYDNPYKAENFSYPFYNGSYKHYIYSETGENWLIFNAISEADHYAVINVNDTYFVEPQNIISYYNITNANFDDFRYILRLEYKIGNSWYAQTASYSESQFLENSSGSIEINPDTQNEELPKIMRVKIFSFRKINPLKTEDIGYSTEFSYNPGYEFDYYVTGYVYDTNKNTMIKDAEINLSDFMLWNSYTSYSDLWGYFSVGVPTGWYTLKISKSGYYNYTSNLMYIDENKNFNIGLTPLSVTNGTLHGTIRDINNNPIKNAYIYITNGTNTYGDYSDENGYYKIIGLEQNEEYHIIVSKTDYFNYDDNFTMPASGTKELDIILIKKIPDITPTPTPPIDEDIEEQLEDLKENINPLKQLIFGLAQLFIDHPDYDKDNIVTENEMNMWFNSLISIAIVIGLIMVYFGVKERGRRE